MMYPRGDHKPHACRNCKGTGRIGGRYDFDDYSCDQCNGTGIEGTPSLWLIVALFAGSLAWGGLIAWFLHK